MSESAVGGVSIEELQLATRNHGMPLEALRFTTVHGAHAMLALLDEYDAAPPDRIMTTEVVQDGLRRVIVRETPGVAEVRQPRRRVAAAAWRMPSG
jgi:hypothetical protein